jgi:hypothetical protein
MAVSDYAREVFMAAERRRGPFAPWDEIGDLYWDLEKAQTPEEIVQLALRSYAGEILPALRAVGLVSTYLREKRARAVWLSTLNRDGQANWQRDAVEARKPDRRMRAAVRILAQQAVERVAALRREVAALNKVLKETANA